MLPCFQFNKKTLMEKDGDIKIKRVFEIEKVYTAEEIKRNFHKANVDLATALIVSKSAIQRINDIREMVEEQREKGKALLNELT